MERLLPRWFIPTTADQMRRRLLQLALLLTLGGVLQALLWACQP